MIDKEKKYISDIVRKEMKGFSLDNSSKNEHYNYLKFINNDGTKTLLVFFDDQDISVRTRMICDYSELKGVRHDLQSKYRQIDNNTWTYTIGDSNFIVNLEEKEWYFVINVKKSLINKGIKKKSYLWKLLN